MTRQGKPEVYTIPPTLSFVDALAEGLLVRASDTHPLSDTTILLPNRRAVRALREAFLRLVGNRPTLLPVMRPIGDVEEEDIAFLGAGFGLDLSALAPAMPELRRRAILMRHIERQLPAIARLGGEDRRVAPAQAWRLAGELARLMDQADTEDVSLDKLQDLVPAELAAHWDITLEFLKIISDDWPNILAREGMMNPAARRGMLIRMLARLWADTPPAGRVIAAGSTGTVPATAELLSVVARLPMGMVVLPGLDAGLSDAAWKAIDLDDPRLRHSAVTHPQAALKALLLKIGVSRHEVAPWLPASAPEPARSALIRDALLPASQTDSWQGLGYAGLPDDSLFAGLRTLVAPTRREEADAIAVLMREVLETPGRTAALVTPDRQLARHVRASLMRWGVEIDDSGGDRALNSLPGRFLALMAEAVSDQFAPVSLLALLQHPLMAMGMDRPAFLGAVRRLDADVLRGVRPAGGLKGILARAKLEAANTRSAFSRDDFKLVARVASALEPLEAAFGEQLSLAAILARHIEAAQALATTPGKPGASQLWAGEAGNALADALTGLLQETDMIGPLEAEGYGALFAELLSEATVRPVWRRHPRLSIWGPLEARLQRANVMVLGGLNEGVWPGEVQPDPWMNKTMRGAFGLPPVERRTGQSAHDFVQAVSAPEVVLTRAEKVDGSPTVPSRWWFRLEALAGRPLPKADRYLMWAEALTRAPAVRPCAPPAPRPPLAARPNRLSVTQVETWMRDPYSLYAYKVLGLKPLDPVDDKPNAAQKGTLLHEALELFLSEDGPISGEAGLERLIAVGRRVFDPVAAQPAVYAFWWPRFVQIAEWFVDNEAERQKLYEVAAVETWAEWQLPGTDFTLIAKADRIDRARDGGTLTIIDYKTGNVPTAKRIAAGFAPQLPLEGLLAENGAFKGVDGAPVSDLVFWKLSGGQEVQKATFVKDVPDQIAGADSGLRRLVKAFGEANTPYLSNPRPTITGYGDYDHLARVKEWRNADDPFDGEDGQ